MPTDDFDATPYVRPPILDVPSGVALGVALLSAVPKPCPDHVKKVAKKLHGDTVALQAAWAKADSAPVPIDRRKSDMRIDNAWGIFLDRVVAYAGLPVAEFPKAARAQELVDTLAKDREWLTLPYAAEWAESEKRLKRIDDEGLGAELDALAGPEFLKEVRAAHKAYGLALGVTKAAPDAPEVSLAEPLRALSRTIARYGVAVAGMVDDDPGSLSAVRKALRPIDDHRNAQLVRRASGGGAPVIVVTSQVTPTTPIPEPK